MYAHLTAYDATRHVAAAARRGAFDRPAPADHNKPPRPVRMRTRMSAAIAHLLHRRPSVTAPAS